jgi:hypothetical protein
MLIQCALILSLITAASAPAKNRLSWDAKQGRVSADISGESLMPVLEQIARDTGWQVFVEPDTTHDISAKFKDLPPGEALRLLLGSLNFALLPSAGEMRLYVFRTDRQNATRHVRPSPLPETRGIRLIANELIIRLKPGANIDEIAKALGAKVVARLDKQNLYRLRFEDSASAEAAKSTLASNPEVGSVENNYGIERPGGGRPVLSTSATPPSLQLSPPPDTGGVIVGLIDTGVQSLGSDLDKFVLKQLSVAGESQLDPSVPSHGTSMLATLLSGLAASSGDGSSSVRVLPVDVYGRSGSTTTFQVAEGIVQAINSGANVINMSLGSEANSPFLAEIIREASRNNITFIGAAGNQPVTTPYYPAAFPEVVAVTAVEHGEIAPYANRGSFVSVGAPGTSVVFYNGSGYYVVGTSSAAAFTSGLAASHIERTGANSRETSAFLKQTMPVSK